jgi:hypothetical protein
MSQFETPGSPTNTSDRVQWEDLNGCLLIIDVHDVIRDITTVHGVADAISADVSVVDGQGAGQTYKDILVFPRVLKGQLEERIGKRVLGRLGQGEAKGGKTAPWRLADATPQDTATATEFLTSQPAALEDPF